MMIYIDDKQENKNPVQLQERPPFKIKVLGSTFFEGSCACCVQDGWETQQLGWSDLRRSVQQPSALGPGDGQTARGRCVPYFSHENRPLVRLFSQLETSIDNFCSTMFSCHYRWTDGMLHTRFPLTHMYICVSTGLFVNLLMCFYLHIDRCWGEPLRSPGKKQIDA